jgi:hypothetical protein
MRPLTLISSIALVFVGGCMLVGNYNYDDYQEPGGNGGEGVGGGGSSTGGSGGSAAMGGQGGMGGGTICPPDICNDNIAVDCRGLDCYVVGTGTKRLGSGEHQAIKAMVMHGGEIVIGGDYGGILNFGNLASLANTSGAQLWPYVAKLAPNGDGLMAEHYEIPGVTRGVAVDSAGAVYGTGIIDNAASPAQKHIFIGKFGPGAWRKDIGSHALNQAAGIAFGGTGRLFVAATFSGTFMNSCPTSVEQTATGKSGDALIMEYNLAGDCSWRAIFQNAILQSVAATPATTSNLFVIGGYYSGMTDLPEAPATNNTASFFAVYSAATREILRKGYLVPEGSGTINLVNVAIDPGDNESVYITAKLQGSFNVDGKTTLTSTTNDTTFDLLVAKFGPDGQLVWAQRFGGMGEQVPSSITSFEDGVFISGTTAKDMAIVPNTDSGSLCENSKCMFLLKLSPQTGLPIWGRAFGGNEMANDPTAVSAASNSTFWLGGGWSSAIDFGDGLMTTGASGQDVVLTHFNALP